jgi:group II intron reverse transcriptase/maturase
LVFDAWKQVKANRGSAGIDEQGIAEFEKDLSGNLYKLWNRMVSGSYLPPPVKEVDIPKKSGGVRILGIPTVADRVAQTAVKRYLEPFLEPHFDEDSYGYRPSRSAKDAVRVTRERCWKYDWVLEFDVKGAFDNLDHDLLMKAVRKHTNCRWVLLYVERWLRAPSMTDEGELRQRGRGTPQGGVISPLLMNLFMHYAFDRWMRRDGLSCPFARYADDAVVHCRTERQAEQVKMLVAERLAACGGSCPAAWCKSRESWSAGLRLSRSLLTTERVDCRRATAILQAACIDAADSIRHSARATTRRRAV